MDHLPAGPGQLTQRRPSLERRVLGSLYSVGVGWVVVNVLLLLSSGLSQADMITDVFFTCLVAIYSGGFILVTWLLFFLPIYLAIPVNSRLWRWYWCVPLGALAGAGVMRLYGLLTQSPTPDVKIAAIAGGVSCLFAVLTVHRFEFEAPYRGSRRRNSRRRSTSPRRSGSSL